MNRPAIISLVVLLALSACSKGITKLSDPGSTVRASSNDQSLPISLREQYWRDASILAVREINEEGGPQNDSIELPQSEIQTYYNSLVRIFNAQQLAARDEVVVKYAIHAFESPRLQECLMGIADTTAWAISWVQGATTSGNATLDSLASIYGISMKTPALMNNQFFVELMADRPINIEALVSVLMTIPGVVWACENQLGTLGGWPPDDISAELLSDRVELVFFRGDWGVNIAWRFTVYAIGVVEYHGMSSYPPM